MSGKSRHRSQKRNRGVLIVIVALAVFLVAAVAGGVSFFTSKKTSSTGGGTTQPAATSQQAGIASGSAGTPTSIPTSTATVAPGATAQPVATVASGMISENLSLTCGTNCNDPIRVTITTIQVNDADGNMIWNITMKNITGSSIS